jgi:hypothetical protein
MLRGFDFNHFNPKRLAHIIKTLMNFDRIIIKNDGKRDIVMPNTCQTHQQRSANDRKRDQSTGSQ